MKGAAFKYGVLVVFIAGVAAPAIAGDDVITDADRLSRNFTREAATVGHRQVRLEVRAMSIEDDSDPELNLIGFATEGVNRRKGDDITRMNGGVFDLLGTVGLGDNAEIGFDIPFFVQKTSFDTLSNENDADIGDVSLYGKFKRKVAERCVLAAGLEIKTPTGIERKQFGTGELGLNPFVSTRYARGRFSLGGHVGWYIYTGSVPDVFNYSVDAILKGSARYALRVEFSGRRFKDFGDTFDDIVVQPGMDYHLTNSFVIRPSGLIGVTSAAVDWGVGLGLAMSLPL
jgi:hypothetical protein